MGTNKCSKVRTNGFGIRKLFIKLWLVLTASSMRALADLVSIIMSHFLSPSTPFLPQTTLPPPGKEKDKRRRVHGKGINNPQEY